MVELEPVIVLGQARFLQIAYCPLSIRFAGTEQHHVDGRLKKLNAADVELENDDGRSWKSAAFELCADPLSDAIKWFNRRVPELPALQTPTQADVLAGMLRNVVNERRFLFLEEIHLVIVNKRDYLHSVQCDIVPREAA